MVHVKGGGGRWASLFRENSAFSSETRRCEAEEEGGGGGWKWARLKIHTINKERRKRKKSFLHVRWSDCVWELRTLLGAVERRVGCRQDP